MMILKELERSLSAKGTPFGGGRTPGAGFALLKTTYVAFCLASREIRKCTPQSRDAVR